MVFDIGQPDIHDAVQRLHSLGQLIAAAVVYDGIPGLYNSKAFKMDGRNCVGVINDKLCAP